MLNLKKLKKLQPHKVTLSSYTVKPGSKPRHSICSSSVSILARVDGVSRANVAVQTSDDRRILSGTVKRVSTTFCEKGDYSTLSPF